MTSAKKKKIVIIGAGVIGAVIAYNLSKRFGCNISIIRDSGSEGVASAHSFAWVNAFGKDPRNYHALNRCSLDMWYRIAHQLNVDIGIHSGGEMRWENNKERAEELQYRIQQLQHWGYPCRLINSDEMLEFEPKLSPGTVEAASYSEADIHIETKKFITACLDRAMDNGAAVYNMLHVRDFVVKKGRIVAVVTYGDDFECDVVVFAAGVKTTELAALVGVKIPQQQSPGIVIKTSACATVLHNVAIIHAPSVNDNHQHLHLRQLADGTLSIGQGTQEGINRDDSQTHADSLLAQAKTYLPAIGTAEAIPTPVGYRPMPLDGFPILGYTKTVPNLYIALMHSGVTLAPIVGEMASMEILDGARVDWFNPYRLERFGR